MKSMTGWAFGLVLVLVAGVACEFGIGDNRTATPTPQVSVALVPEATPMLATPTATPSPSPTPSTLPTATVTPAVTPTPTATPMPTPSPTPTPEPPSASFSVDVKSGSASLFVTFSNESEGPITSIEWDFGDGATSTYESPGHRYTVAGVYSVRLTVTGPGGTDAVTLDELIQVGPGNAVAFEVSPPSLTLSVQDVAQLTAIATDVFGNAVPGTVSWAISPDAGFIDSNGQVTAGTVAGDFAGAIEVGFQSRRADLQATASVIVAPGPLESISITPPDIVLDVLGSQSLAFEASDEFGNEIVDSVTVWSVSPSVGEIVEGTFKVGTKAGDFPAAIEVSVVRGSVQVSSEVDVTILPGPLANLAVEPAYAIVEKGDTQQFSAVGTDEFGNVLADLAVAWETTGESISQAGEFSAGAQAGRREVSASALSGREATGTVTVDVPTVFWNFTEGEFGWAGNSETSNLTVTSEGLEFDITGVDPWIEAPPLFNVGGADLIISIRMKSTANIGGRFWWGEPPDDYMVTGLVLFDDGEWHTYEFQIPQQEGRTVFKFQPTSSGLRLEPVTSGEVTVSTITVIPNPSPFSPTEDAPTYQRKWGIGQSNTAHRVATDSSGNIYVTSAISRRVQKFTPDGDFLAGWGSKGDGDGEFGQPRGIAIDTSGYVYIADFTNNRIQKFDSDGDFISSWGDFGNGPGQFWGPHGITTDPDGYVYVTDRYNRRVQKFTSEGLFVTEWGSYGDGEGHFLQPLGIAVHPSGDVYVVGGGWNQRIQRFTSDGELVMGWGSLGSEFGRLNGGVDLAIDSDGDVYVAEDEGHRIQKFTEDGVPLMAWGSFGSRNGEFNTPFGLTIDPTGRIVVADTKNNRIQIFVP